MYRLISVRNEAALIGHRSLGRAKAGVSRAKVEGHRHCSPYRSADAPIKFICYLSNRLRPGSRAELSMKCLNSNFAHSQPIAH
jgi:hypothetical protein